jgi:predicted CXXCH cytochrome family protein
MKRPGYRKTIAAIIIMAVLCSCSPGINYKLLTVFFDGVPPPETESIMNIADSTAMAEEQEQTVFESTEKAFVVHPPYQERDCSGCHDRNQMGRLASEMPELCYICHEDFSSRFKTLHGPVEGGYCTECHNPHMNQNASLLIRTGQELCLYCHEKGNIERNEIHEGLGEINCLECHNPHGGEDRYILN